VTIIIPQVSAKRALGGFSTAIVTFVALGTIAALWDNSFFIRMTPAGEWEVGLLALLSLLSGLYVVIRRPFCSNKTVSVGGVLSFLGVACPVCNKILLLAFGSELLLTYFEPVRIYAAAGGILFAALAVLHEWQHRVTVKTSEASSI
jgi:hypothetical protein